MAGLRGANCVLNLAFRVAKKSMLLVDSLENHSNASPVRKVENTRHQIRSLTAWSIIWWVNTSMWLSGFVMPSYLSKVGIFHLLGRGVFSMNWVKGKFPEAWIGCLERWPPSLAPKLSAIVWEAFPLDACILSTRAGCDCSGPVIGSRLFTRSNSRCYCTLLSQSGSGTVGVEGKASSFRRRAAFSSRRTCIYAS